MSVVGPDCRPARLHIGADPRHLPPEVSAHLGNCAPCRRFLEETLALDARLQAALELPLARFRRPSVPRRLALAASLVMAFIVAGGFWLLRPAPALAAQLVEHVSHESASWEMEQPLPASAIAEVLHQAGVQFDTSMPVVYAMACPFHGRRVPHLVVQTASGPITVMLLIGEPVAKRTEFSEGGLQGVLLPAGRGSVALLTRGAEVPAELGGAIVSGVRW